MYIYIYIIFTIFCSWLLEYTFWHWPTVYITWYQFLRNLFGSEDLDQKIKLKCVKCIINHNYMIRIIKYAFKSFGWFEFRRLCCSLRWTREFRKHPCRLRNDVGPQWIPSTWCRRLQINSGGQLWKILTLANNVCSLGSLCHWKCPSVLVFFKNIDHDRSWPLYK